MLLRKIGTRLPQISTVNKCLFNFRSFSDSHDDFKPKKKDIPSGMEDVMKLIDEQVKSNDIMLYMKGSPSKPQVSLFPNCNPYVLAETT